MEDKVRIGVYICRCGTNIAGTVDVKEVAEFVKGLPAVVVAKDYMYMCSDPGQNMIKEDIKQLGLNRVVVASCSPNLHEHTFRQTCQDAGLNLATAIELGKKLGYPLPRKIVIFAIEVANVTNFSERYTPEVEKAIPRAVEMIAKELNSG